jgi:hypothetical protein
MRCYYLLFAEWKGGYIYKKVSAYILL